MIKLHGRHSDNAEAEAHKGEVTLQRGISSDIGISFIWLIPKGQVSNSQRHSSLICVKCQERASCSAELPEPRALEHVELYENFHHIFIFPWLHLISYDELSCFSVCRRDPEIILQGIQLLYKKHSYCTRSNLCVCCLPVCAGQHMTTHQPAMCAVPWVPSVRLHITVAVLLVIDHGVFHQ